MNSYFSLVKVQLKQIFASIFSANSIKSRKKYYLVFAFLGGIILFSVGMQYYGMATELAKQGATDFSSIFIQAGMTAVLFLIFLLALESQGHFFKTKDFELLQTLPISPFKIISAKMVAYIVSSYLYTAIILLPAVVIYFAFSSFVFSTFLTVVLWFLAFPLLPSFIACLLGLVFAYINASAKNPQILSFVCAIIFLIFYFVFYYSVNDIINSIVANGISISSAFTIILPSIGFLMISLTSGWYILAFIALNLLALILGIWITSTLYTKLNIKLSAIKQTGVKKPLTFERHSMFTRLIKTETKNYFTNSVYLLNTFLMAVLGAFMPLVIKFLVVPSLPPEMSMMLLPILFVSTIAIISSCNTASVSLSLEGKKFFVLKSLPVKPSLVMNAKICFNIIIVAPLSLLASILSIVLFGQDFSLVASIMIFVLPIIAVIGTSIFGMLMNLCFPKLDFISYTQVVKQSASAGIGMLGSMLINALPFIVYFVALSSLITFDIFLLLAFVYFALLVAVLYTIYKTKGEKMFNKIIC